MGEWGGGGGWGRSGRNCKTKFARSNQAKKNKVARTKNIMRMHRETGNVFLPKIDQQNKTSKKLFSSPTLPSPSHDQIENFSTSFDNKQIDSICQLLNFSPRLFKTCF